MKRAWILVRSFKLVHFWRRERLGKQEKALLMLFSIFGAKANNFKQIYKKLEYSNFIRGFVFFD